MKNLLDETLHLLDQYHGQVSFADIAAAIGVHRDWVYKVFTRKIPNPGVLHVQALYEQLADVDRKARRRERRAGYRGVNR